MSRRLTDSDAMTHRIPRTRTPEAETLRISRYAGHSEPSAAIGAVLDHDLSEDTIVDRYRPLELLGRGGMGEVSRSLDTKIGREVALKTMLSPASSRDTWASSRFIREARVQALLEHPAIVPVYDIGHDDSGRPFFTMKRVRGQTLEDVLRGMRDMRNTQRRVVTRHRVLSAFVTVCLALHYAHERGVVHRDLKPDNIMLGAHGEVHVLDWGVARVLNASDSGEEDETGHDTRPGEMVGTPGYMSPEQVLGQLEMVDARSDVFALGAILYEVLTLEPLIPGDAATLLLEQTIDPSRPPPPPKDMPPELYVLCLNATKFHKSERPASARALADAVERYLDGDRDEELRRRVADERTTRAKELANEAIEGPQPERERCRALAMREASRALGIFPEHEGARAVVLRLLATPPSVVPLEVIRETEKMRASQVTSSMRDTSIRAGLWVALFPLLLLMGPRIDWMVALALVLALACMGASFFLWKKRITESGARLALFSLVAVFGMLLSTAFGPLVFVPAFAAVNTVLFGAQSSRRHRPWIFGLGCATIALPLVLELAGVIPRSMVFSHESVTLLPRLTWFNETASLFALTLVSFIGVIAPALVAARLRDALLVADERLLVHKWHMEQLAPPRVTERL
ncbi:MAG: protein kinase [Polyangiaceae bacterium]|nr:protein kinase [Polyangiaceae bacterium]